MLDNKSQTIWSYIHSIVTMVLRPLSFLILAKLVTPEDYGLMTISLLIVTFVEMIRERGFTESYIKHYKTESIFTSTLFIFSIISGVIIYMFVFISTPLIISYFNIKYENIQFIIQITSIQIILNSIYNLHLAEIIKNMNYKLLAKIELGPNIIPFIITIPLAYLGYGIWALIIGLIISSIIKTLLLLFIVELNIKFEFNFTIIKDVIKFMKYIFLESFLNWFYVWGDKAILSNFITLSQLGFYTVATQIINLIYGLSFSVSKMNYAHLCSLNENIDAIKNYTYKYINFSVFTSIILFFSLYHFAYLVPIILGERWNGLDTILILLGVSFTLSYTITGIVPDALKSMNMPHIMPRLQFLKLLYTIPIFIISAKYFGFEGFLLGKIITVSIGTIIFYYISYKYVELNMEILWKNINIYIYGAIISFVFQFLFSTYVCREYIFCKFIFYIVYVLFLYFFNRNSLVQIVNLIRGK